MGGLTLDYEALGVAAGPGQTLGLPTATTGSPSEHALRLLAASIAAAPREPVRS